uniref:Uncharacterized protein n=1 Tax=Anguilla anguilla TaxID=7936 RepID=A0A0E9VYG6_ANGAN
MTFQRNELVLFTHVRVELPKSCQVARVRTLLDGDFCAVYPIR